MKRHKQLWFCPICTKIIEVRRRLTDRKPRCCGEVMLKIEGRTPR